MADPRCPRCGVPLLDQPDYCWSCGRYVGDRWRNAQIGEGDSQEPRVVGPEASGTARPVDERPTARRELTVTSNPWLVRLVALAVVVIVVLLAVALLGGGGGAAGTATMATTEASPATTEASPATTEASPAATAHLAPSGPTTTARVTRVVDGDTIIVAIDGTTARVRYIGMDTPESVRPDTPVEPMGEEAAAANRALVEGREVVLERDVSEADPYGRLLRDVWVERDGELHLVGLELVRQGFAQVATFPPDVKYVDELLDAQRQARSERLGLWAES